MKTFQRDDPILKCTWQKKKKKKMHLEGPKSNKECLCSLEEYLAEKYDISIPNF